MEKGTTVFYHHHIQSNIAKLEQRKDRFINNRIQFLKQFCLPIQDKIDNVRNEIQKYKIMRDTQEEIIETDPEIYSLKSEVTSYKHTQEYFNQKVSQYEQKAIEYQEYNHNLKKQLQVFKKGIKNHHEELGFKLPYLPRTKINTMYDQSGNRSSHGKSIALPVITHFKSSNETENSLTQSKFKPEKKKIINISEKIQRFKSYASVNHREEKTENLGESIKQQLNRSESHFEVKQKTRGEELRSRITEFNNTESLFHDCLEVKKNSVQRSVSQLQSKLIANREQFLNTCHAIGSKEKISFEQFNKLSSDQILTLFISFVWLNKKINAEFMIKRKLIMDYIGKLPKLEIK